MKRVKCQICNTVCKNLFGLSRHIHLKHENTNRQKYYDKYLLIGDCGKCVICGNKSKFNSMVKGYYNTCTSKKCKTALRKQTCLKKYGVENVMLINDVKEKLKTTVMELYGVDNISKLENIKNKKIITCLKKYGVENPNHIKEVRDKILKSGYQSKSYILPSGKEVKIQGYEWMFLDEYFNNGGLEEDISTQGKDIDKIWYYAEDDKKHRYYPDFYIKSTNTIIEVKSVYTYNKDLNKNLLKERACLDMGYEFEFKIYNK